MYIELGVLGNVTETSVDGYLPCIGNVRALFLGNLMITRDTVDILSLLNWLLLFQLLLYCLFLVENRIVTKTLCCNLSVVNVLTVAVGTGA